ncbi:MAG: peptidoglycan DD-metalloendopeptidase family protein [Verrucomicrobiota bacterium JB023]|nr:peptidoglycan DD-metalloendopeptidase family protein [Verrucomicrobiota bacterium JB023]
MHRALALFAILALGPAYGQQVNLRLPTENRGLLTGDLAGFYMPTDLNNKPPESGAWGFVRNVREFPEGRVYTRFHEGLDIRPMHRDARGLPTDMVKAIATGTVVYANDSASRSNYGKYVVVRHDWGYGPFYSLYAHLATTTVKAGQPILAGDPLGRLGSTGAGLNNARAHVHLELNIMLSERFNDYLGAANPHGNHNGLNLSGFNLAEFYLLLQKNPRASLAKYLHSQPQHYRIMVPRKGAGTLPIVERYPWLRFGNHDLPSKSWEIACTRSGFLVGIAPSNREVSKPTVTYVRPTKLNHRYYTLNRLTGTGSTASLTASGERFVRLITDNF